MKPLRAILLLAAVIMGTASASAIEYRKCKFDIQMSSAEFRVRQVRGTEFTAWARRTFASDANDTLNELAQSCLKREFGKRLRNRRCHARSASSSHREGLAGYEMGARGQQGNDAILQQICSHPGLGKQDNRSPEDIRFDKRVLTNFQLVLQSHGGVGRCDTARLHGPVELTIFCRMSRAFLADDVFGRRRWEMNRFID